LSALTVGGFTAALFFCGCGRQAPKIPQKKLPQVRVEAVKTEEMSRAVVLTGSVEPYRVARLASPAEGPVVRVRVREGDRVRAGDRLLAIGRRTGVNALIASLREELKKEEDNLRRTGQLVEKEALPKEQLDMAAAGYEKIKAQLVRAEETSGDYSIAAPWSGVVSKIFVKDGDFVAPRTALVEIYDPSSLVLRAEVPEKEAATLHNGMSAEIGLDAYPGKQASGKIVRMYPYLHERMRTRTVEIELADTIALLPGMFGRIRLKLESVTEALTVPVHAVVTTPKGGSAAFTITGGKAAMRNVTTGIEDRGRIQIVSGLSPNDSVVVAGNEKLKDGMEIRRAGPPVGNISGHAKPGASPANKKKGDGE